MRKLREKEQRNKIGKQPVQNHGCISEQYLWFSFRDVTKNDRYDLSGLKPGTEREQTIIGLHQKMRELSGEMWLHWMQMPKTIGLETLTYGELNFSAANTARLSKDTTVYVFRFDTYKGRSNGRLIGYKNDPCAVFHIIGYDIDFSAYDHGK